MKTDLLSFVLAVLGALAAPSNPATPAPSPPPPQKFEEIDEDGDGGGIAFVDGVICGLVCPTCQANDSCGKVAAAPAGWWGSGAGHHLMIDVTYGCLAGHTWLVRESYSQPEPGGPQPLPPRAQRAEKAP